MWMAGLSFAAYTILIIGVGVYSSKFNRNTDEDYFLAGRSLGPWTAALSASASSESGWVTLGLVGWAFTEGIRAYWIIPGCVLGFIFNWFVLAAPLQRKSNALKALTLPDFFSLHYKEKVPVLRVLSVIVILTAMTLYVASQFAAAGKSFSASFQGINYQWGVILGASIVLIYTITGGFRAVVWTDFLQGLLMVGTLVLFPVFLLITKMDFAEMFNLLKNTDPEFVSFFPNAGPVALFGFLFGSGALGINFGYPGQPHVLVRFMSMRSDREIPLGGVISVVWAVLVYAGAVTIGLMARAMSFQGAAWTDPMIENPEIYGELGLVLSAIHLMPGILSGLVLAAVLSAICSTADSQLAVAGSMLSSDLYQKIFRKEASSSSLFFHRVAILGVGFMSVLLVWNQEVRVYQYVLTYGWAILGASFGPQIILLLFWKGSTREGAIAGMITGFTMAIAWANIYDAKETGVEIYNLPFAFMMALSVHYLVSRMTARGERFPTG